MLEPVVTNKRKRRIYYLILLMLGILLIVTLVLYALKQNINLFYTPSQLFAAQQIPQQQIRVGGFVKAGSIKNNADAGNNKLEIVFVITDFKQEVLVCYNGVLPDLFREGQGVVALGRLDANSVFMAKQILAKHDEKYRPPELADVLKQAQ
jgi:cytochrome c-type biogenesis protein CcmE